MAPTASMPSSAASSVSSAPVMRGFCLVKAVRIHEDGGPEVLRYEDVDDPTAGPGEVLVSLRAAGLNHLDVWVRRGCRRSRSHESSAPTAPASSRRSAMASTGFEVGDRVVINPGIPHDGRITVIGEHTDGTYCELKAIPCHSSIRSTTRSRSRKERRSRSPSRPRTACSSRRPLCGRASGCSSGASAEASRWPHSRSARAHGARTIVTSSSAEKLERARALGADVAVDHATTMSCGRSRTRRDGRGADIVVETVGEATWERSLGARRRAASSSAARRRGTARPRASTACGGSSSWSTARRWDGAVRLRGRLRAHPLRTRAHPRRQRSFHSRRPPRTRAPRVGRPVRQGRPHDPGVTAGGGGARRPPRRRGTAHSGARGRRARGAAAMAEGTPTRSHPRLARGTLRRGVLRSASSDRGAFWVIVAQSVPRRLSGG